MLSRSDVGTIMADGTGTEFLIVKVNKANTRVSRVSDGREGMISTFSNLKFVRYPTSKDRMTETFSATQVPLPEEKNGAIRAGAIVTLKSIRGLERSGITTETKLVVLKVNPNTVSVVEVGGRADGVFYRVPEKGLTLSSI